VNSSAMRVMVWAFSEYVTSLIGMDFLVQLRISNSFREGT